MTFSELQEYTTLITRYRRCTNFMNQFSSCRDQLIDAITILQADDNYTEVFNATQQTKIANYKTFLEGLNIPEVG